MPVYLGLVGGLCVVIGFYMFGHKVLATVGKKITKLSFRSGFAAQFAAALTVLLATVLGL